MIARLARIIAAYLAANVAAGLALALVLVLLTVIGNGKMFFGRAAAEALVNSVVLGTRLAAACAFIPAAVIITIAEAGSLRSSTFYGVAGIITAIAAWLMSGLRWMSWLAPVQELGVPFDFVAMLVFFGPGGLVGGLAYWRIAGRNAGAWRARDEVP